MKKQQSFFSFSDAVRNGAIVATKKDEVAISTSRRPTPAPKKAVGKRIFPLEEKIRLVGEILGDIVEVESVSLLREEGDETLVSLKVVTKSRVVTTRVVPLSLLEFATDPQKGRLRRLGEWIRELVAQKITPLLKMRELVSQAMVVSPKRTSHDELNPDSLVGVLCASKKALTMRVELFQQKIQAGELRVGKKLGGELSEFYPLPDRGALCFFSDGECSLLTEREIEASTHAGKITHRD